MSASVPDPRRGNKILGGLSTADFDLLRAALRPIQLEARQILHAPAGLIQHAFFPTTALVSVLRNMEDGRRVKVASIGREGIVGIHAALGAPLSRDTYMVQVPGEAFQIDTGAVSRILRGDGSTHRLMLRYVAALLSEYGQLIVCSMLHSIEQRCCRWLAMLRYRTGAHEFPVTHQEVAQMLGVRRASVTEVARTLQKDGFIEYRRGRITILDTKGIESAACECYRIVKETFDRLFVP
jgi:CRP-like cAMP-binding protein